MTTVLEEESKFENQLGKNCGDVRTPSPLCIRTVVFHQMLPRGRYLKCSFQEMTSVALTQSNVISKDDDRSLTVWPFILYFTDSLLSAGSVAIQLTSINSPLTLTV